MLDSLTDKALLNILERAASFVESSIANDDDDYELYESEQHDLANALNRAIVSIQERVNIRTAYETHLAGEVSE